MGKHVNVQQEDMIIEFMENNPQLAKGFSKGDKVESECLWQALTDNLNSIGPPTKSKEAWKKAWLDKKSQIKKKISTNKKEARTTGGGPNNQLYISNREEAIGKLCGLYDIVDGIEDSVAYVGQSINATEEIPLMLESEEVEENNSMEATPNRPPKRKIESDSLQNNLKKFMVDETNCYAEISKTLVNLLRTQKENTECMKNFESNTKRIYRSLDKISDHIKEQTQIINQQAKEFVKQGTEKERHYKEIERLAYEKNKLKAQILELKKEQRILLN